MSHAAGANFETQVEIIVNSHAGGVAVAQSLDFEIDFARNLISESAA